MSDVLYARQSGGLVQLLPRRRLTVSRFVQLPFYGKGSHCSVFMSRPSKGAVKYLNLNMNTPQISLFQSVGRWLEPSCPPPQHRDSNRSLCILADQARASTPFLRTAHNCRADKRQDRTRPDDIERATRPLPISGAHTAVFEKRARHLSMTRPSPSRPPAKENAAPEHARNRVFALPQGNGIRTCPERR